MGGIEHFDYACFDVRLDVLLRNVLKRNKLKNAWRVLLQKGYLVITTEAKNEERTKTRCA